MTPRKPSFKSIPKEELLWPSKQGIYQIIDDAYWTLDENGEFLVFILGGANSPQCNTNPAVAERFVRANGHPSVAYELVPRAFFPVNPSDFC